MAPSINQYEPGETTGYVKLNMDITNNNNGTTYDSGDMDYDRVVHTVFKKITKFK